MDLPASIRLVEPITRRIDSVTQLDLLLLLYGSPDRLWNAGEVASELRIGTAWAEQQLGVLSDRALLVREQQQYRYARSQDLEASMQELTRLYRTHPVGIIAAIYRSNRQLEDFADAFRIRRPAAPGEEKGGARG